MVDQKIIGALPSTIGVYIFYENKIPIYVGKSINIKARILSHLANSKLIDKEQRLTDRATDIKYFITLSEFESLLLEAKLIRKYLPVYNVVSRDDKSCLYIKITSKEPYPKVLLVRRENDGQSLYFGPFPSLSVTTKIVKYCRRIIPFCTSKSLSKRPCFYSYLGLCNPCPNTINRHLEKPLTRQYHQQIKKLILLLSGKNNPLYQQLERELKQAISKDDFDEGIKVRNRLMALQYLNTSRFINNYDNQQSNNGQLTTEINNFFNSQYQIPKTSNYRIECYDISNLSFNHATGSMVVFEDGQFNTSQYRKFKIKIAKSDPQMLTEMLKRRFNNKNWRLPDLLLIDGGRSQLSVINRFMIRNKINIPIVAITKNPDRFYNFIPIAPPRWYKKRGKTYQSIDLTAYPQLNKVLVSLRNESHRFAKKYHILLRDKNFLL